MQAISGVIFRFTGGFASNNFHFPYTKLVEWELKSYWIIGSIFYRTITPFIAVYLANSYFFGTIKNYRSSFLPWTYPMPATFFDLFSKRASGTISVMQSKIKIVNFITLSANMWSIGIKEYDFERGKLIPACY